jgi:hypothetical protein
MVHPYVLNDSLEGFKCWSVVQECKEQGASYMLMFLS